MQADFKVTDMVEVAILNGLSRFPVYRESVDDVVGIVYAKDLMRAERDGGGQRPVRELDARRDVRARDEAGGRAAARDAD